MHHPRVEAMVQDAFFNHHHPVSTTSYAPKDSTTHKDIEKDKTESDKLTHRTRPPHPQRQDLHRNYPLTSSTINVRLRVDLWVFVFERQLLRFL
jgi:hypothetical protein